MRNLTAALTVSALGWGLVPGSASEAAELNIYSTREPALINPVLAAFTQATGIRTNVAYIEKGVIERLKIEGANSPADAVLTVDVGVLYDIEQAGVLQPIVSTVVNKNVDGHLRDPQNLWTALTYRARVLYTSKDRVKPGDIASYEDLTKPSLRGKVCTRSAKHEYNISLIASVISHKGVDEARRWLDGVKVNLGQKAQGNDRAQAKAIMEGVCDVSIVNTYYYGLMATNDKEPEQKQWAASVKVVFPNQADRGTHVNVSGIGITKSTKHKAEALKLVEFLTEDQAQHIYARDNFEYPVKPGVKTDPLINGLGDFKIDRLSILEVAKHRAQATRLVDEVGFEQFTPGS